MNKHDTSKVREIKRKVLSNLIRIDMTRTALSTIGSSNTVNKTNLANVIYANVVKTKKEK